MMKKTLSHSSSIVKCLGFLVLVHSLLTLSSAYPVSNIRQADETPAQSPSIIPIPNVDSSQSPFPSAPIVPITSTPSTPSASAGASVPAADPTPSTSPIVSVTPEPQTTEEEPTTEEDGGGGGLSGGIIAGIILGALAALVVLYLCCTCLILPCFRRDRDENDGNNNANRAANQTAVYSSSEAAATPPPPPPPSVVPPPTPFAKDDARQLSPDPNAGGGAPVDVVPSPANLAPVAAAVQPEPVARGPTPPPHDYVLGVGPATTRKDFDDLQAKYERDEIGDDSAVLGIDRSASAKAAAAAATATAPPEGSDSSNLVKDPADDIEGDTSNLQGSSTASGLATFERQEEIPGGDGSGAISDATMGLNAATITEEGGDVPSLERDPIELSREHGEHPF